jgi:hypothetical protein
MSLLCECVSFLGGSCLAVLEVCPVLGQSSGAFFDGQRKEIVRVEANPLKEID